MNILFNILETKRPTNHPEFCLAYTVGLLRELNIDYTVDVNHNVIVELGGTTCFTSHTDTVDNKLGKNELSVTGTSVTVKGGGVLGADCGSGMYVMIRMIQANVLGHYVFFSTEEQGRVGSGKYIMPAHITKCISFDRKGTDNLITHQMGERGCSDDFAVAFIGAFDLPYKKDPTGSFTDSYSFFDTVPECINLSVGYYNQHTKQESQDIVFLETLVDACIAMDWEALPVVRDPSVTEWDDNDWNWYKKGSWTPKADVNYNHAIRTIDDFVYEYPYLTADVLSSYGITLNDLMQYKDEYDSALPYEDEEEAA